MMNYIFRVTKSENATLLINNYYSVLYIQLLTAIPHFNDFAALSLLSELKFTTLFTCLVCIFYGLFYFILYLNFFSDVDS